MIVKTSDFLEWMAEKYKEIWTAGSKFKQCEITASLLRKLKEPKLKIKNRKKRIGSWSNCKNNAENK